MEITRSAPNEKHWHGASPTAAMTHVAIQEALDDEVVEWMEQVTEEEYRLGEQETPELNPRSFLVSCFR